MSFKASLKSRTFKSGAYSLLLTAALLAVIVLVNVLLSLLPSSLTRPSISPYDYYSLTDATKKLVSGLSAKIELNYVVTPGSEDAVFPEFVRRYCELNEGLTLKYVDPTASPAFVEKYQEQNGGELSENSVVVINKVTGTARVVDFYDVYTVSFVSSAAEENYYYYGDTSGLIYSFAGEPALTAAIEYVTIDLHPTVYQTVGHGESDIGAQYKNDLTFSSFTFTSLNLATQTEIDPEESVVLINSPKKDFSDEEITLLRDYMKEGGKVYLLSYYANGDLPKLYGLMAEYGMKFKPGLLCEGNVNHFSPGRPYLSLPNILPTEIAQGMPSQNVNLFLNQPHAIDPSSPVDSNEYSMTVLLQTSKAAYIRVFGDGDAVNDETIKKQEGDEEGQFTVGAVVENSKGGGVTWIATPYFADDSYYEFNREFLLSSFTYLTGKDTSITIATKPLADTPLTVSSGALLFWAVILIAVIPLGAVAFGLVIWNKRRKQ